MYYDLTPIQRGMVRVFYLAAFTSYVMNRYILRIGSMVQGGNFVVSRDALETIGGFNLNITFYGEDTDIERRLNEVGTVRFTFGLKIFSSARRPQCAPAFNLEPSSLLNHFAPIHAREPLLHPVRNFRHSTGPIRTTGLNLFTP